MKLADLTTMDQLIDFLTGTQTVAFSSSRVQDNGDRWMQRVGVYSISDTVSPGTRGGSPLPDNDLRLPPSSSPSGWPPFRKSSQVPRQKARQKLYKSSHGRTLETG